MKEILLNLLALVLAALTPDGGEIPAELQSEVDSLKEAIGALPDETSGEDATPSAEVTNTLMQRITDLAGNIKAAQTKPAVMDKITEAKFVAVNAALKSFDTNQKGLGKNVTAPKNFDFNCLVKNKTIRVLNANNANFEQTKNDEFSFEQKLRQDGFLMGLKNIPLNGENIIRWVEGARGANATAVIAIGNDRPAKTNTTSNSSETTNTIGQQTTVSLQLLKTINGVKSLYEDDLRKDIDDTIALQVAAMLAAANNPINVTATVNEGTPTIQDVIKVAYLQLKPYAGGNRIVIAISTNQMVGMSLLKDKNGNALAPISFPDLDIVTFLPTATYTDDHIFGWVADTSVRFYNDGVQIFSDELNGIGVSGDNFKKSQISIAAQYLNEGMVIRGTDVVTTIYDSINGVITELTAGA